MLQTNGSRSSGSQNHYQDIEATQGREGPEYGIVGTAAHCVNSVAAVCAAEPGILTMLDLPLISGKAAPGLG